MQENNNNTKIRLNDRNWITPRWVVDWMFVSWPTEGPWSGVVHPHCCCCSPIQTVWKSLWRWDAAWHLPHLPTNQQHHLPLSRPTTWNAASWRDPQNQTSPKATVRVRSSSTGPSSNPAVQNHFHPNRVEPLHTIAFKLDNQLLNQWIHRSSSLAYTFLRCSNEKQKQKENNWENTQTNEIKDQGRVIYHLFLLVFASICLFVCLFDCLFVFVCFIMFFEGCVSWKQFDFWWSWSLRRL